MKKHISLLLFAAVLILSSCHAQKINKRLQEFSQNLATADIELRGKLILIGEYKGDLSTLTYDNYLVQLRNNEKISTKGVADIVQQSNQQYFEAKKNTFFLVIYSKRLNVIIFDDANTFGCDSIKVLKNNEAVPKLSNLIRKYR